MIYFLLNFRFSRKKYIIVIRRRCCSNVQQSNVTSPWALIQTLIHFMPMMGVNAKPGTTCGLWFILSWTHIYSVLVDDLCSLGGFPCFVPGVLKAREFNYSLLIFEEDRLCQAVVTLHASTALGRARRESFGRFPHCGRTILVKSNEV